MLTCTNPAPLVALALILSPNVLTAADAEAGRILSEEVCAACHDISPTGVMKEYPPSFRSIAIFRDDRQIRARIYSPPAHAAMPVFAEILFPDQVANLVAYIRGLED